VAKKVRVLVVIRHPVGGIRTYLKYTYRYLDHSKYKFTVLTVKDVEGSLIRKDLSGFELEILEVQGRLLFIKLVFRVLFTLNGGKFDLIHSQGFTAGLISVFGNLISRTPHILTSHDVFRKNQFLSWSAVIKKWLLSMLLGQADFIQSVSYDAQENLLHFLPALKRKIDNLVVIRNGVLIDQKPMEVYQDTAISFRKKLGIDDELFLFGFMGRFMPQKGFYLLIDAVELLSNKSAFKDRFRIAAVNDGAFIREYRKIIADKELSSYFFFCGFTPNVNQVLLGLDALVIPSLWEACPLLPAEALVIGCPVIASDCIGLREVLKDTPAIVIRQNDPEAIAENIIKFIQQPETVKKRTLEYIPIARKRFSSERTAAQLEALFEKVLAL
jgi:glycosyltransferase involved in cell wall biosynthesis